MPATLVESNRLGALSCFFKLLGINRSSSVNLICIAIVASAATACGGGTTGTSPTDSFKLIGITENAQSNPLAETSMSVVSASNNNVLVDSQTDSNGNFSMELPADEPSLVVDVVGSRSTPLVRELLGSSIVSTKLVRDSSGFLSFSETFEAQIDRAQLCQALSADGNQLISNGLAVPSTCPVTFNVRSSYGNPSSIQATLRSDCEESVIARSNANNGGALSIDVAQVLAAGCGGIEITVSQSGSALQGAVFLVLK